VTPQVVGGYSLGADKLAQLKMSFCQLLIVRLKTSMTATASNSSSTTHFLFVETKDRPHPNQRSL